MKEADEKQPMYDGGPTWKAFWKAFDYVEENYRHPLTFNDEEGKNELHGRENLQEYRNEECLKQICNRLRTNQKDPVDIHMGTYIGLTKLSELWKSAVKKWEGVKAHADYELKKAGRRVDSQESSFSHNWRHELQKAFMAEVRRADPDYVATENVDVTNRPVKKEAETKAWKEVEEYHRELQHSPVAKSDHVAEAAALPLPESPRGPLVAETAEEKEIFRMLEDLSFRHRDPNIDVTRPALEVFVRRALEEKFQDKYFIEKLSKNMDNVYLLRTSVPFGKIIANNSDMKLILAGLEEFVCRQSLNELKDEAMRDVMKRCFIDYVMDHPEIESFPHSQVKWLVEQINKLREPLNAGNAGDHVSELINRMAGGLVNEKALLHEAFRNVNELFKKKEAEPDMTLAKEEPKKGMASLMGTLREGIEIRRRERAYARAQKEGAAPAPEKKTIKDKWAELKTKAGGTKLGEKMKGFGLRRTVKTETGKEEDTVPPRSQETRPTGKAKEEDAVPPLSQETKPKVASSSAMGTETRELSEAEIREAVKNHRDNTLAQAIRSANFVILEVYLKTYPDTLNPDPRAPGFMTALGNAIEYAQLEVVKWMFDREVKVIMKDIHALENAFEVMSEDGVLKGRAPMLLKEFKAYLENPKNNTTDEVKEAFAELSTKYLADEAKPSLSPRK